MRAETGLAPHDSLTLGCEARGSGRQLAAEPGFAAGDSFDGLEQLQQQGIFRIAGHAVLGSKEAQVQRVGAAVMLDLLAQPQQVVLRYRANLNAEHTLGSSDVVDTGSPHVKEWETGLGLPPIGGLEGEMP